MTIPKQRVARLPTALSLGVTLSGDQCCFRAHRTSSSTHSLDPGWSWMPWRNPLFSDDNCRTDRREFSLNWNEFSLIMAFRLRRGIKSTRWPRLAHSLLQAVRDGDGD